MQPARGIRNWVEAAVYSPKVGGPTKAARLLDVSNATIHRMIGEGRMPTDTEEARQRVVTLANRSGVPAINLVGLGEPFSGQGGPTRGNKDAVTLAQVPRPSLSAPAAGPTAARLAA